MSIATRKTAIEVDSENSQESRPASSIVPFANKLFLWEFSFQVLPMIKWTLIWMSLPNWSIQPALTPSIESFRSEKPLIPLPTSVKVKRLKLLQPGQARDACIG